MERVEDDVRYERIACRVKETLTAEEKHTLLEFNGYVYPCK